MKDYILYKNINPNGKSLVDCKVCNKRKEHHAKGMCYQCYKKKWRAPRVKCKNCERTREHKAFGLCNTCHARLHHYDKTLAYNAKKDFGLDLESFKRLTKECVSCKFTKIVALHHIDLDKKNNTEENLVPLCPNCHRMIHSYKYFEEVKEKLQKKGYNTLNAKPRRYWVDLE